VLLGAELGTLATFFAISTLENPMNKSLRAQLLFPLSRFRSVNLLDGTSCSSMALASFCNHFGSNKIQENRDLASAPT
jgi:hypothetical protein